MEYYKRKSENRVVNILEFGRYLLKKCWVLVIVSFVMVGTLLGKLHGDMQKSNQSNEVENYVLSETEQKEVDEVYNEYKKFTDLQEYIDQSILMEINPYKEYRKVVFYEIEGEKIGDILSIYMQYLDFGIATDIVTEELNNTEPQYLDELVSGMREEKEEVNSLTQESNVLGIRIIGKDKIMVDLLTQKIDEALQVYTSKISTPLQPYELKKISETEGLVVDNDIVILQGNRNTKLKVLENNYTSMKAELSSSQLESLANLFGEINSNSVEKSLIEESLTKEESTAIGITIYMKYIIFGILLGIILGSGVLLLWYMYGGNINSIQEFQEIYNIKVLEEMQAGIKDSKKKSEKMNVLLAKCKLLCSGNNIRKIIIVGETTTSLGKEIVRYLKEELKVFHVELEYINGFLDDAEMLSYISEFNNVILIEEIGKVKRKDFEKEQEFFNEQNMYVMGVIPIWV